MRILRIPENVWDYKSNKAVEENSSTAGNCCCLQKLGVAED